MSHHRLQQAAGALLKALQAGNGAALELALLEAAYDTSVSKEYKNEMVQRIEDVWLSRAKSQSLGKPSTLTYKKKELEFFLGAMSAINEILPRDDDRLSDYVPPRWVFSPMTGDNIVKEK